MNREALKLLAQLSVDNQCLTPYGIKVFNSSEDSTTYKEECITMRKICEDIEKTIAEVKSFIPA